MALDKQSITLVFPHQLFWPHPAISKERKVVLLEEWLFFSQYKFHKIKLTYHRATMKAFQQRLKKAGFSVEYIDAVSGQHDVRQVIQHAEESGVQRLHICDVHDNWLHRRIIKKAKRTSIDVVWHESPMFITSSVDYHAFFDKQKRYFQTDFYIWQRRRLNILIESDGKPIGGKWTFDGENRKPFPKGLPPPVVLFPKKSEVMKEAWQYVERNFEENYGEEFTPLYPIDHESAVDWFNTFLRERFQKFGEFEDAMVTGANFLHHSVLTPMLNTGLLTPEAVVNSTLDYAAQHDIPINSIEGFIRQVIGWREFMMAIYHREGGRQRTMNYWQFSRKIPEIFYTGNTGIPPVDDAIQKLLQTGYNHHIERLMILGNFFLLCEFDPNEVYKWFMEMYIDAYDWVMVPNVYGMTQFADGGLITTKPYISGSNYILKMSNYPKGDWQQIWDGLFWRFMVKQRDFFSQNPRLGMLLNTWDKMSEEKKNTHLMHAENYLDKISIAQ